MDEGALRDLEWRVVHALWLGPAQELCDQWLRHGGHADPTRDAAALVGAARRVLVRG